MIKRLKSKWPWRFKSGGETPLQLFTPDERAKTIINFESPYRLREMLPAEPPQKAPVASELQQFKIRIASSDNRRHQARMLIQKMYLSRGYKAPALERDPYRITVLVSQDERVVGTTTLGLDSTRGLLADQVYKTEIDELRQQKRRVGELTKLAIDDQNVNSKHIVAVLFHLCKIYGHDIHRATDLLIEINPRHALFYQRMLEFQPFGPERMCVRVKAPAVLLRLPMEHAEEQIRRYGGQLELTKTVKSLYPYCFSKDDEVGIIGRLQRGD